jgi:hypothetical protein
MLTIDSYYLTLVLDYGILGIMLYFATFIVAIRYAWTGIKDERQILASYSVPISIALLSFIVIKAVFSQPDNHPMVYMILGMLSAVEYNRQRVRQRGDPQALVA